MLEHLSSCPESCIVLEDFFGPVDGALLVIANVVSLQCLFESSRA